MTAVADNLYGLILAGGHSKRMGQDKSVLIYHGKTQIEHAYDLLSPFCAKVFVSNRADQAGQKGHEHLPQVHDLPQFSGIGPLAGILSAMTTYPKTSWLVFACDLPFITPEAIDYLIGLRNPDQFATAFISSYPPPEPSPQGGGKFPEPLCAIWEAHGRRDIEQFLREGIQCPRKILLKSNVHLIIQKDPRWLDNVNTPQEYEQALKNIH